MLGKRSVCKLVFFALASGLSTLGTAQTAGRAGINGNGGPLPQVGSMPSRRFEKIADGVYYATSTGSMQTGANSCVIVNENDVFLLDPGESPATARALVDDIKT